MRREANGKAGQRVFPQKNRGVGLQENGRLLSLTFARKSQSFGKAASHENVSREEKGQKAQVSPYNLHSIASVLPKSPAQ